MLVICRHAKSDWTRNVRDFDRPLNKRGLKDAPKMGKLLAEYGFKPDMIISSPANRAKTTAELVATEMQYETHAIRLEQSLYDEGPGNELSIIQDLPESIQEVMIFGHNPTQEGIARYLLGTEATVTMPTCAMIAFEVYGDWKTIESRLVNLKWFLIPRMLK